ncbi:hypothetical protein D3C59_16275 [Streptomyces sp. SHP22-7]|nr:hypothetical protein D3C59_16275 [Streptomyces sp. SHP22-7]RSS69426.1 hypothetical protein EF907_07835 [Streptomyces sp. WAC06273]
MFHTAFPEGGRLRRGCSAGGSVVTPDGTVWRYRYDPRGRRVAEQRLGGEADRVADRTDFTWDGATLIE